MIIELTTLDQEELSLFTGLTEAQLRNKLEPEKGIFIAESPKVIHIALAMGYQPKAFLMERRHLTGQGASLLSRCGDLPVYTGDRSLLSSLTGYQLTRGILCAMERKPLPKAEDLLTGASRVAVLEAIVDTTNVGALFRSAAALSIDAILLSPTCCDPLNRRALRVSMGTVLQIPYARLEEGWPEPGMSLLRSHGFFTVAMALKKDALSIDDPLLHRQEKLAIVLGTEGDGLSASTIASCDAAACIPMMAGVDSLNVAAAGSVAFWELRRR